MNNSSFSPPGHWSLKNVINPLILQALVDFYVPKSVNSSVLLSPLAGVSSQSNPFDLSKSESVLWHLIQSVELISAIKYVSGLSCIRPIHYGVLLKAPGAPMTAWHRDRDYLPISSNVFTAWIPLSFISSHFSIHYAEFTSCIDPCLTKVSSTFSLADILAKYGDLIISAGDLYPGDIDIHEGHTWHYAPANTTSFPRVALGIAFVSDGTCIELCPSGFDSPSSLPLKIQTLSRYFPNLVDGDLIEGPCNPAL